MCDPILVTLLRMRPHDSQSSHENATPFSGTSPLAPYKEVSPPPGSMSSLFLLFFFVIERTVLMVLVFYHRGMSEKVTMQRTQQFSDFSWLSKEQRTLFNVAYWQLLEKLRLSAFAETC